MTLNLTFWGAAGTVTGSKYLLDRGDGSILVDCGMFQGFKSLRLRNWARVPFEPGHVAAVVLTHAHIDHSGALPLLVKQGFGGDVFCSQATAALCEILLPDAGYLQEKDAEFANRHGFSKHKPALPLFSEADARQALRHLIPVDFGPTHSLPGGCSVRLRRSGHILGAASAELHWANTSIVFSGDLGRTNDPIMADPEPIEHADYLVVESTYGDRRHDPRDPKEALAKIVGETVNRGGTVVIPAFAVGRAQSLLFHFAQLKADGRLTHVPIFLDSPMAIDASALFCRRIEDHKLSEAQCRRVCAVAHYIRSVDESKSLNSDSVPKVIISASGMATGGRVLHHLKHYAPDARNTILFAGFQAPGTRGATMVAGADSVRIHGEDVPVRADVKNLDMLSAHADSDEIMRWLCGFRRPPRMTFITHGEPAPADALRQRIERELRWPCLVPDHGQKVALA